VGLFYIKLKYSYLNIFHPRRAPN